MKPIEHYRVTKEATNSKLIGFLAMLPDIFVILHWFPNKKVKKWSYRMHNTKESINVMSRISSKLALAWAFHKEQDEKTHNFSYK
jgi:hypothetical protein